MSAVLERSGATIVIPCAGAGHRLAIHHPKELVPLGPNDLLIDRTFALLQPVLSIVNVVVVTNPAKLETVRYLERYTSSTSLAFVYQSPAKQGLYGAIRAALPWCQQHIVVLLPDEVVVPETTTPNPIAQLIASLRQHPVAFLIARESDRDRLAADGALAIDGSGRVVGYADKSRSEDVAARCHAIWTGFAFDRDASEPLLDVMAGAQSEGLLSEALLVRSRIAGAPTVTVQAVHNLGDWPGIYRYMAREVEDRSRRS